MTVTELASLAGAFAGAVSAAGLFLRAGRVLREVEALSASVHRIEGEVRLLSVTTARLDERSHRVPFRAGDDGDARDT